VARLEVEAGRLLFGPATSSATLWLLVLCSEDNMQSSGQHPSPRAVLEELTDRVCRFRDGDDAQVDQLAALYAEDAVVVHPFHPLGQGELRGRAALREHFAAGIGVPRDGKSTVEDLVVHETMDPEVVIGEFAYRGVHSGEVLNTRCVFVVRVRDGEIVESHDYVDHLATLRTMKALDSVLDRLRSTGE
jgi:ketosteroid isomerase-like protein